MPETPRTQIVVNGRIEKVDGLEVTYDQIVNIAYPDGSRGPNISYTITYYNGAGDKPEGGLAPGETTKIKDGTVFNVTRTDRS